MPLDPSAKAVVDLVAAAQGPRLWEVSPPEARAMYEAMVQLLDAKDVPIGKVEDIEAPGPAGAIPLRVYTPVGSPAAAPALIYLHGGGFVIGSRATHDGLCRQLANEAGCTVISVDYRLAPEHKFPAAVEDAFAAALWIERNATALGIDANRLAIGGDSAGGNLATVVCQLAKAKGGPALRFQLLIYPVVEARAETASMRAFAEGYLLEKRSMDWFMAAYLPDGQDPADPRLSPLHAASLAGLPPALVVTAGHDPLRDEGIAYVKALEEAGVRAQHRDHPGQVHGFFNLSGAIPEGRSAIAEAAEILKAAIAA